MKKKKIVLIRHGETAWNAEERWQGHINIPLNHKGRTQAIDVGRELEEFSLERLFSSDLLRARQTAELIAGRNSMPIQLSEELREVNVGEAEGLNRKEMVKRFGDLSLDSWGSIDRGDLDFAFPGGETKRVALSRAKRFINEKVISSPRMRIGIVSHGMLLRTLLHDLFPWIVEPIEMKNCDYFVLGFDPGSGGWTPPEELREISRGSRVS